MKQVWCWIVLIPLVMQAQVRDDFSDGNFTSNPVWSGDTSSFAINPEHQLQLNSSGSDTSILVTQGPHFIAMEWSFWIKLSFNTSANNYARVYLSSDSRDIASAVNAVYLQVGGSGDSLVLFRQNGNNHSLMYKFPFLRTYKSVNVFRIKICRDSAGIWELYADSTGGKVLRKYGCFTGTNPIPPGWFGVFCRYTSGNSKRFYFDDFYAGEIIYDTIPPRILSTAFSDSLTIRIKLSETIDSTCLENGLNFSLKTRPEKLRKAYILKEYPENIFIKINASEKEFFCDTLIVKNISDISNNFLSDTSVFLCYHIPGPCLPGDLVINEVLFHPDASGSKFIEFYNRSSKAINLHTLSVGSGESLKAVMNSEILSDQERILLPQDYYVVTADSSKLCSRYYVPFPSKIREMGQFPAMDTDSGSVFLISDADSLIVDAMKYSQTMHLPFLLNTEGISLERLDAQLPSDYPANWQSATETSGYASPGYENSHYALDPGKGMDLELSTPVISPDNDGRDDLLYIKINNIDPGTLLSLRIFNLRGNPVKILADQTTVSENSLFIWDGTGDNKLVVPIGYYIIFSESISVSGKHSSVKKAVVLAQKL